MEERMEERRQVAGDDPLDSGDAASERVLSVSTIAPVHVQLPSDCTKPDGN